MANEIKVNLNVNVQNGEYNRIWNEADAYNQTTLGESSGIAVVTTTFSTLPYASVATPGYLFIKNLDTTNNVSWGIDVTGTYTAVGLLQPNEVAFFRVEPSAIQIAFKAVTTTLNVQYWLLES